MNPTDDRNRGRSLRQLTKSILRAPWAATLFGVRQASLWVDPRAGLNKSASEIDEMSDVVEERLDETLGGLYRAGKHVQEGMVDALFDLARGPWAGTEKTMAQAWRAIDQGWSRVRRVAGNERRSPSMKNPKNG